MKKILLVILTFLACKMQLNAQSWGEYTLVAVQNQTTAKLINLNKATYKTWTCAGSTAYSSYVLPGGTLLRTVKATGASFSGGGMSGRIQKVDWNNAITWDYTISDANKCAHHDICALPNGNVLVIVYERKTAAQGTAVGYSSNKELWTETIMEVQPNGTTGGTVVWQWSLWDHLIQNVNSALPNFGVTNQHPELLNINYKSTGGKDWVHANGIDYNAALDQIVLSSHFLNEMYVIDHSTTTAQAASHSGGTYGKGGDFLYRWGNPAAYGATGVANFNVLHDAHWVPSGCPNAGQLSAFSNNGASPNSSVDVFAPPVSGGVYSYTAGTAYGPSALTQKVTANGFSSNMGSGQQLPNGNTLVCIATAGTIHETNAAGTTVWTYNAGGTTAQASRYSACYINGLPTATITPSVSTVCTGGSATLNLTPGIAGTYTYAWSGSNGFNSTLQNPVVNPTSNTTYSVTISSGVGCSNTFSTSVNVGTPPTANAGTNQTISTGQTANLAASGGTSYTWNTGQTGAAISVTPSSTTTYIVTVTNASGCTATSQVTVTVNAASVTATASSNPTSICEGASAQIGVAASGGNGIFTYSWSSVPTGFASSAQYPSVSPTQTTTYTCIVTSGTASTTVSTTLTVNALPTASAGANQNITAGETANLSATGGGTYSWNTGQNNASISVMPSSTTTYTVTVTNGFGCTATAQVTVGINTPLITAVAASTPNTICQGVSTLVGVSQAGGNGNFTYSWTSNPAGFTSSAQYFTISPSQTTTYTCLVTSGTATSTASATVTVNALPNASAGSNQTITTGQIANLAASGGNSYTWSTGQTGATISVTPSSTTIYTVTVSNASGCSAVSSVTVNVGLAPIVVNVSATPTSVCLGDSSKLNISASGGNGIYNYTWTSIPAGFVSNLKNPSVAPSMNTTYNVVISSGNINANSNISISVKALPIVNAGKDTSIYLGQIAPLLANGGVSYVWSNGVFTASNAVSPSLTTTYKVTATDANGCKNSDEVVVNLLGVPLSVVASASKSTICKNDTTQLLASVSGGSNGNTTYAWTSVPVGFSSNLQNPKVVPNVSTTYNVSVQNGTSSANSSVPIIVLDLPVANAGANVSIVKGKSTTLNATGGTSYVWNNGVTTAANTVAPTSTSTYTVTVSNVNACTATASVVVTILQSIVTTIIAPGKALCKGESITLQATAVGGNGAFSYKWYSNPIGFTSNIANLTAVPTMNTTFIVVVNDGKISDTSSITIKVNPLPNAPTITVKKDTLVSSAASGNQWFLNGVLMPNVSTQQYKPTQNGSYQVKFFDANGCESVLSEKIIVSNIVATQDLEVSKFVIYPNPSRAFFNVNDVENRLLNISILNAFGQKIMDIKSANIIDLSTFPKGVYYAVIYVNDSNVKVLKKLILVE